MEPIDVRDLLGDPGYSRRVTIEDQVDGLRSELVAVSAPVRVDVLLESVVDGIYVTGLVTGLQEVSCSRCLISSTQRFRVEVGELFAREADEEADEYHLGGEELDLDPMIRDAILLEIPFSPLCRPDCLGLCERCGEDRNLGECSCPPLADPRWAPLLGLKLD
jgi:uncharacterized protein